MSRGDGHYKVGENVQVEAMVDLPQAKPEDVTVQLYCGPTSAAGEIENPQAIVMQHARRSWHRTTCFHRKNRLQNQRTTGVCSADFAGECRLGDSIRAGIDFVELKMC